MYSIASFAARTSQFWLGVWLATGILGAAPALAQGFLADNPGEFRQQAENPILRGAKHNGLTLFQVGGLPLLENSEYFSNEWYFDPSHSLKGDIKTIDLSGGLAKSVGAGSLWETSGFLPRGTQPSIDEGVLQPAHGAGAIARSATVVNRPMVITLCGLALLSFLWELSGSFRRPVSMMFLGPALRSRGRQ